ncbi:SMC-Scp complex subunit ScpB [Filimonas effusa]|uniref:SMC-Scp complex subunit ScpB n=1 Tax=Filimonas effusa TaxID=2508721 RepID=A0A4Q1D0W3_9BACT|nr:SMC-Scp complex subunit ScpB [Filimonas effusa]RXK81403.1 SMC-Scp complex subunit ScpB [Filimonas effusa]
MELSEIIPHIEVLIFASEKPLTSLEIVELINNAFGFMEQRITLDQVESSIEGIREKYQAEFYPFEVRESGGGWQFLTKKDFHKTVAQLNGDKFLKRLSNAALETLAIIAYKQPITKGEIESIRGVNSDYSIQKLLEKELIIITGRNEELPGKPLIYSTSKLFMDYFGINSAADLPKIKEVLAEQMVAPTIMSDLIAAEEGSEETAAFAADELPASEDEIDALLAVDSNGDLVAHEEDSESIAGDDAGIEDAAGAPNDETTDGEEAAGHTNAGEEEADSDELPEEETPTDNDDSLPNQEEDHSPAADAGNDTPEDQDPDDLQDEEERPQ